MKASALAVKQAHATQARASALPNAVTLALGKNIQRFRLEVELSQEQLAHNAEIERSRISKMENGRVNPSLLTLATLCHCLEISLPQLFEGVTATLAPSADGGPLRRRNQAHAEKPAAKSRERKLAR